MTELWPRLPLVAAEKIYADIRGGAHPSPATSNAEQSWSPVGGRVAEKSINLMRQGLVDLAGEYGFPDAAGRDAKVAFDRAAAQAVRGHMQLSWAEAGARDLWSFVALVVIPDLTLWRFGTENRERWVASDLTRHTWGRLWWQAVVFEGNETLLGSMSESDLNQLLERRRAIGGDPRVITALAQVILNAPAEVPRRFLIRDVAKRFRRRLAFIDLRSLDAEQVAAVCSGLAQETIQRFLALGDNASAYLAAEDLLSGTEE